MMYNTISHPYLQQGQDIYNSCNQLSVSDVTTARDSTSPNFKTLPPINLKQSTTHIPVKISFPSNTISPNIPDSQITNTLATITDIVSPQPFFSYSPQDQTRIAIQKNLKLAIEEIKRTESQYLSNLKTLKRDYFEKLIEDIHLDVPVPIKIVYNILAELIQYHDKMTKLFERVDDTNIFKQCEGYCSIIAENGINLFWYKWYCSQHQIIQDLYHEFSQQSDRYGSKSQSNWRQFVFKIWFTGWQNFFESQQGVGLKKDFSLMSLLQRPIDRITKYRLFVETICKNCIKLGHSTANIQNSFERICNQLNQINRNTEDRNIHKELFELIDFSTIRYHEMQIDFQFFGIPYLVGTCWAVYVENKVPRGHNLPILLFKSHLILIEYCHYSKRKKFELKFVVPVIKCHLDLESTTSSYGLHTTYPHCIKVLFEIGLCHYELLLCWLTKTDYDIWCEELTVIVCFVNGNDVLQKQPTTEATQYLYKLPTNLSPYDINTTSESFTMRQGNCYFKQCLLVKIVIDKVLMKLLHTESSNSIHTSVNNNHEDKGYKIVFENKQLSTNERFFRASISKGLHIYLIQESEAKFIDFFLSWQIKNQLK